MTFKLYAVKGYGSLIPELVLQGSGLECEVEYLDAEKIRAPEFLKINPIGQVPALRLENGEVMTESLAICTHLCERARLDLVPAPTDANRARYLHWSTFLVASLYPTFTYGDEPKRFVTDEKAQRELKDATDRFREKMWLQIENATGDGPFFLGEKTSVIDLYLAVMAYWRPRGEWFAVNAPRIWSIVNRVRETTGFKTVFDRNR